ncbi:MAG: YceI family protein [Flavisolibacter sp.]|jgi:polyisoprenoid-binding protein YceI|nr:YceI family protein [Flavisolibacter sp.]
MKKLLFLKIALIVAINFTLSVAAFGQINYHTQVLDIKLNGTSNLHDWEMKAVSGTSDVSFVVDNGKVTSLSKMNFSLPVKNLKSGKGGMDKNTYKALKSDANPNIAFVLTSATVKATGGNNYQLTCVGKMTIAGTTNQTELLANGTYNPTDKSFTVTGLKKMKMTDYNVQPPKALLGTIKTGNDISISYNVKFKV